MNILTTMYKCQLERFFLFLINNVKNCNNTADRIIVPPINPKVEGLSLTNSKAHIGPNTDSESIIMPTIADGVVLAPIVININPKPT